MDIALIGSGNTATVLGRLLTSAGHNIAGVYSKTAEHAQLLAVELNAQKAGGIDSITHDAELYIVAIKDDLIGTLANTINLGDKTAVHTSGSVPMQILKGLSKNYGVLYPLQSLRKEALHQPAIPFLIDGSNAEVKQQVRKLAESISSFIEEADDDKRLKLHLAAVMVSNFTNHLYSLAEDFCMHEGVPFKMLVPLMEEVADRAASYSPATMQTGPAVRGDKHTIERHLQQLAAYPKLQRLYKVLTESIMGFYSSHGD